MTAISQRIAEFDTWRPGYAGAAVRVYVGGTTTDAALFADPNLTEPVANPQTLGTWTDGAGATYGKFSAPVYVGTAYALAINSTDTTGVADLPLTALAGADASLADVTPTAGGFAGTLADLVARIVDTRNFGALSTLNSAANTTILANAIGAAGAAGGGEVLIPPGTWPFTTLTLPANVVLRGYGAAVTTIQSQAAANVVTIAGDNAGFRAIRLDGVNLIATSTGVYGVNRQATVFDDAIVSRFDTGLWLKGGRHNSWRKLTVSGCNTNAKLSGDADAGASGLGDVFRNNEWIGGLCTLGNTIGVDLFYKDKRCSHWKFQGVGFEDSSGTALQIKGARFGLFEDCWWLGNTGNLTIEDDTDTSLNARRDNTCIGLHFRGGFMAPPDSTPPNADTGVAPVPAGTPPTGGTVTISGLCQDILFEKMEFDGVAITLNSPQNNIVALDCVEDSNVTISGVAEAWTRRKTQYRGASFALTSAATPTIVWALPLLPGELVLLTARITARQRNGILVGSGLYFGKAHQPGATMDYTARTATFTAGDILTGSTSGATARITADTNGAGVGTLTLQDINGTFQAGEIVKDTGGGSATSSGPQTAQATALITSSNLIVLENWAAAFVVSGAEVQLQVTGGAGVTIEWSSDVETSST